MNRPAHGIAAAEFLVYNWATQLSARGAHEGGVKPMVIHERAVTTEIAGFIAGAKFENLPDAAVHETKRILLDSIGCAIAGLTTDKGKLSVQLARRLGGPSESTVIGAGGKVSAANAAFANGELINAMDWDVGAVPPGHSTPAVLPACLALAEPAGASGRDLITAVVLGHEVSGRLGAVLTDLQESAPDGRGLMLPPVHGYSMHSFGAAAAAGKILDLDREKMASALGIAGYMAPVPSMVKWYKSVPAAMTKYAPMGWIAQVGVTAALLSETGYTGDACVLDGDYGFWRFTASNKEKWDPGKLTQGLGENWLLAQPGRTFYKHYPFCGLCHTEMDEFLKMIEENDLRPEDIESIRILSAPLIEEPIWTSTDIRTHVDAQFSVPFAFAVAAHRIKISAEWQSVSVMRDPRIREFMKRVSVGIHPEGLRLLEVAAKGRVFSVERRPGVPVMTDADNIAKFEQIAQAVLPTFSIERALKLVLELETVEDINTLTKCISL